MSSATEMNSAQAAPSGRLGLLLAATGVSVTGDGMLIAAAPLMAASITDAPLAVASVAAAGYAAWLVAGLPAGALVDRWPRRRVMVISDLARAALLAGFTILAAFGQATIALLAVTVFLIGVGSCFFDPASQTAIPNLVGRDLTTLAKANGHYWAVDTFGRGLAGPPLGAVSFAAARALPFGLDAISFLISAGLVAKLPRSSQPSAQREPVMKAVASGIRYLLSQPVLRLVTFGMAVYNFGYNVAFATLVLFAGRNLDLSAAGFGFLLTAMAIGGIAGGWIGPKVSLRFGPAGGYAAATALQAAAWLLTAAFDSVWITAASLAAIGLASTTVSVVGGSARQLHTPDGVLGRVMSTTRLLGIGFAAIGAMTGGLVASQLGLSAPLYVAAGFLTIGAIAFMLRTVAYR